MYSRKRTISTQSNSSSNSSAPKLALVPKLQPVALSESVQVTVRCRPPKKDELNNCWDLLEANKITSNDPKLKKQHQFTFGNKRIIGNILLIFN